MHPAPLFGIYQYGMDDSGLPPTSGIDYENPEMESSDSDLALLEIEETDDQRV